MTRLFPPLLRLRPASDHCSPSPVLVPPLPRCAIVKIRFLPALLLLGACAPAAPGTGASGTTQPALRASAPTSAEQQAVMATVVRLFDGMRASDTTVMRSAFHPSARLQTTGMRDGAPVVQSVSIDQFLAGIARPHDEVYDERIWNAEVRVDDNLATAWMNYAFFVGERLSHCGVNAFQLFRAPAGWQIIQVTDTRRQQGCQAPPQG